jgi:subtilase family serine protease
MRNVPDVAMIADNVWIVADRGRSMAVVGTSIAAPLWAGFTALVNQQAAAQGQPPVGFLNPAIYAIGQGVGYTSDFHDITAGNTTNSSSPELFFAVSGYDLCTGGNASRTNLINALLAPLPELY